MTDEEIRREFLLRTYSNTYSEDERKVLELNKRNLKKFYEVDEIIIK